MPYARQADYDQLVKEMISEGASVEEASCEAQEVFKGSGYDMAAVYIYDSVQEMKDKEQVESKFRTLEDKAALSNYVNSYLAIKSLEKVLASSSPMAAGTLKLAETRKLFQAILKIVIQTVGDSEEEDEEDEDDDDDVEENKISQKETLIGFAVALGQQSQPVFLDYLTSIAIDEATVTQLCQLLDEDSGEPRVVERLLDLLALLCRHDENRALCAQKGLAGVLDLAVKMNKKSPSIATKAASLLAVL